MRGRQAERPKYDDPDGAWWLTSICETFSQMRVRTLSAHCTCVHVSESSSIRAPGQPPWRSSGGLLYASLSSLTRRARVCACRRRCPRHRSARLSPGKLLPSATPNGARRSARARPPLWICAPPTAVRRPHTLHTTHIYTLMHHTITFALCAHARPAYTHAPAHGPDHIPERTHRIRSLQPAAP